MVELDIVQRSNATFAAQRHDDLVSVFVGATSGIGASTLDTMATLLVRPRFHVIGRSASRFVVQRQRLLRLNPDAEIVFIEAEISRLADVDKACKEIAATEQTVDFLCMSPGYLPVAGPVATEDGPEQCFTLSYFARIRFLHNLLPLLRRSKRPRVLSILNAGGEAQLCEDDLELKDRWTMFHLVYHATTFMTLVFDRFAQANREVAFIHSGPGQVRTEITRKPSLADSDGLISKLWFIGMRAFMSLFQAVKGITPEESGQRHAYILTSDRFGPGMWRVVSTCEEAPRSEIVEKYRGDGWPERIWDLTIGVWDGIMAKHSRNPAQT